MSGDRSGERLVALFLLGLLLLMPPALLIFNRPVSVGGIPLLYLYLLAVWAGLIALAALVSRALESPPAGEHGGESNAAEAEGPPRA